MMTPMPEGCGKSGARAAYGIVCILTSRHYFYYCYLQSFGSLDKRKHHEHQIAEDDALSPVC
jgi:hypothetical protein